MFLDVGAVVKAGVVLVHILLRINLQCRSIIIQYVSSSRGSASSSKL
jgi:hypothetical protein